MSEMNKVNVRKFIAFMERWWLVILGWLVEENEGSRLFISHLVWSSCWYCWILPSVYVEANLWSDNFTAMVNRKVQRELAFRLSKICGNHICVRVRVCVYKIFITFYISQILMQVLFITKHEFYCQGRLLKMIRSFLEP